MKVLCYKLKDECARVYGTKRYTEFLWSYGGTPELVKELNATHPSIMEHDRKPINWDEIEYFYLDEQDEFVG